MKSNNNIQSFLTINDLLFVINNWYFKAYCKIISNALKENRKKLKQNDPQYVYYESHHIHPHSLGGSNDRSNLALLTKHEHFLVHWLLTKCISGKQKYSMMYAFNNMLSGNKGQDRYIPKHKFAKIIKQNRESIIFSEEHKRKISNGLNNRTIEQKAEHYRKQKETNNNKSLEEKVIESKNKSEAAIKREGNKTLDEKAEVSRKLKETKANKTPEQKAEHYNNIKKVLTIDLLNKKLNK